VSTVEKAEAGDITFLANKKYAGRVKESRASAIIAAEPVREGPATTLVSTNPYLDFARVLSLFHPADRPAPGIHNTACVAPSARLGANCFVGPYAVIGENTIVGDNAVLHAHSVLYQGCVIGNDFTAHSHVSVREFTRIGDRVTLHNGVVIGGDGFGFARDNNGRHQKIPQSGVTVIEDDVEIQTLTSIDRAALGETRIRRGTKIDSLCQIGHACDVGEDGIICGQTGLAGSTIVEENVILAGQVGSAGHLTIGKNAIVFAQAGIPNDVPAGAVVNGYPAIDSAQWLKASAIYPRLPEMLKTIRALERKVAELQKQPED
jgi:UDP-3-O-[3-hydroxymyristoyl] glucosamine N-acyltransferase